MRLILSGSAPRWAAEMARSIIQGLQLPFEHPVRLQPFANAAALPAADKWKWGIVAVEDLNMVAVSDGTNWRRLDTGATL